MAPVNPLSSYKALSFDIYGTLVDWESGLAPTLSPLATQLEPIHPCKISRDAQIAAFNKAESAIMQANPTMRYDEVLKRSYLALAEEWGLHVRESDATATAESLKDWQAFPDTVAAMQALGKKYKLIALSNTSRSLIDLTLTNALKDVHFDAVYVAEDIGSYKPDHRNFEYLLQGVKKEFGVEKGELLHVAHGVRSDQVPAEQLDISHVWIRRGKDNWGDIKRMEGMREFETLGDLTKEDGL